MEYCTYHKDHAPEAITKPLRSANLAECNVCEWDIDFVSIDKEILFELILAANYMDIRPLLDLCCAKVASMIRGKTVEQIRSEFNIVNDFTPEKKQESGKRTSGARTLRVHIIRYTHQVRYGT